MTPRPFNAPLLGIILLASPLYADPYAAAVLSDNPLAYFALGDAPPAAVAINSGSLGTALNGSHIGVEHRDPGALLDRPSTSNYYAGGARTVIPYSPALNPPASQSFTIEAWVKPTINGLGNAQAPLFSRRSAGNRQGWVFFQRDQSVGWNFRMYNENGGNQSINITGGPYTVGSWCHLALVWNGPTSTATLYVDGVQVGQQSGGYVANSEIPFSIGAYSADNPGDNPYTGNVDEVAFYPSAQTQAEINGRLNIALGIDNSRTYAAAVAAAGATLHLRMDEHDPWRSVAVNRGTLGTDVDGLHFPGATHQVPGALAAGGDTAMRFDMIDKVSTDGGYPTVLPVDARLNTPSFSWEGWVKPLVEGNGNAQCVISNYLPSGDRTGWVIWQRASVTGSNKGDGFGWNFRAYNGIGNNRTINITTGNGAGGYTIGQWQHLAVTFDAGSQTAVFYVNGTPAGTQTATSGPYVPNQGNIVPGIGGFANGSENPFKGDLDEIAFYDTVLTPVQVAARYANGINPAPTTPYPDLIAAAAPLAYYRMNEPARHTTANLGTLGTGAAGAYANSPAVIAGPAAPALPAFDPARPASLFNANRTYVDLLNPDGLNFAGDITLEAWVSPDSFQPNFTANLIAHGGNDNFVNEVFLRIENGNYEVGANGGKASFAIPAEDLSGFAWVHLAGTWSAGQWRLFRNGSQVASGADANGAVLVNNANWSIGARGRWKYGYGFPTAADSGALRGFAGGISDVAIYNSALPPDRLAAHFLAGVGTRPLVITRSGGAITLEWNVGILQQSDNLGGWADVIGATSPYSPNDGDRHFYRLRF